MVWDLVATAAAGLQAGAGLQAAIGGTPSASDSLAFARFAGRTRVTGLLLSTISTSACLATYFSEDRGSLWLAAAAGVGISIPFHLLMMSPPTAVLAPPPRLEPYSRSHLPSPVSATPTPPPGNHFEEAPAPAGAYGEAPDQQTAFAEGASAYSSEGYAQVAPAPVGRRLMYAKSGLLVRPEEAASSWGRRFWFSALLSLTAFGCMMSIVVSGKDAATYTMTPF